MQQPVLTEFPPLVIKELKEELIKPLTILFKTSVEKNQIPDDWRLAVVTPSIN